MELSENTKINKYAIELIDDKPPLYRFIYTLNSLELETLIIYIKAHTKIRFIQLFKSSTSTFILFDKKPDSNLYLCITY